MALKKVLLLDLIQVRKNSSCSILGSGNSGGWVLYLEIHFFFCRGVCVCGEDGNLDYGYFCRVIIIMLRIS